MVMTASVMCDVAAGTDIGSWHRVSDCVYGWHAWQFAGTDARVVWTCAISCTHCWRKLSWPGGTRLPFLMCIL